MSLTTGSRVTDCRAAIPDFRVKDVGDVKIVVHRHDQPRTGPERIFGHQIKRRRSDRLSESVGGRIEFVEYAASSEIEDLIAKRRINLVAVRPGRTARSRHVGMSAAIVKNQLPASFQRNFPLPT